MGGRQLQTTRSRLPDLTAKPQTVGKKPVSQVPMASSSRDGAARGESLTSPTAELGPRRTRGLAEVVLRLFAITVPALYAMGRFYASSWWQGIGLPASLERYAFEDYLFLGFYAALGSIGEYYIGEVEWRLLQAPFVVALCVFFYLTINSVLDWLAVQVRGLAYRLFRLPRLGWLARAVRAPFLRVPAISAAVTLPTLSALTTLFVFMLLPLLLAENAGARDAQRLRARLNKGMDVDAFPRVYAAPGMSFPNGARLIQCTPEWCVVHANRGFHALPKGSIAQAGPAPILSDASSKGLLQTSNPASRSLGAPAQDRQVNKAPPR